MTFPFYNSDGEFRLLDPDVYCLMLTHTGTGPGHLPIRLPPAGRQL